MSSRAAPAKTFVIVRPPPSLTQSPLNLQIQLLAPSRNQRRDTNLSAKTLSRRSSTTSNSSSYSGIVGGAGSKLPVGGKTNLGSTSGGNSLDAIAQASVSGDNERVGSRVDRQEASSATVGSVGGGGRKRSGSVGSHRSGMSSIGTGSSMHSASSVRRVLPVYNLTFSSVLSTVVTDAGTDEKISKWLKRGIEIINFAILDPTELHSSNSPTQNPKPLSRSTRSRNVSTPEPSPATASPNASFFNKFKKLSFKTPSPAPNTPPATNSFTSTFNSVFNKSADVNQALRTTSGELVVPLFPEEGVEVVAGHQVKGYSWTVRKWLRKDLVNAEGEEIKGQLVFEWRRGNRSAPSVRSRQARQGRSGSTVGGSRSFNHLPVAPNSPRVGEGRGTKSFDVPRSASSGIPGDFLTVESESGDHSGEGSSSRPKSYMSNSSRGGSAIHDESEDEQHSSEEGKKSRGEPLEDLQNDSDSDGDPDDLEKPWYCHLIFTPDSTSPSSSASSPFRKVLLGILTPAPYHPRLVAHLSVPFFSSVGLTRFNPANGGSALRGGGTLSVDEMKDVLSITALWLVVKESLGGIDERRKGDRKR